MSAPDLLFGLRNNFYLGAYQAAINNSDVPNLSPDDAVERDCLVYRSYIALGSYQVLHHGSTIPTPIQDTVFQLWHSRILLFAATTVLISLSY